MTQLKLISLIFICLIAIIACEGNHFAAGHVVDEETRQPIEDVQCFLEETETEVMTDSSGYYHLNGEFGSCAPDCSDMHVRFSKSGYKTIVMRNPGKDTVFMSR